MRSSRAGSSYGVRAAAIVMAAVVVAAVVVAAVVAASQPGGAAVPAADQLAVVRERAAEVARAVTDAEARRNELEGRIAGDEDEIASLLARIHQIEQRVRARAADLYIRHAWTRFDIVMSTGSVIAGARASQLTAAVGERERALATQLQTAERELAHRRASLHAQRDALDEQIDGLVTLREQLQRQIDAAVRSSRRVDARADTRAAPASMTPAPSGDAVWERFRECTFAYESGGDYGIVSPGGTYHGAWQFLPSTWNAVAGRMGRDDLVGTLPSVALPADQDAVAHQLWLESGNRPWGGRC